MISSNLPRRIGLDLLIGFQFAFRMIGIRISSALRQEFLTALFSQSVHVLDSMPPGYATTIITSASNTVQLGISEKLGVFFEFNATMISSIIIAFIYSWQLSLVTFTAVVFIVLSVSVLMPPITLGQTRQGEVQWCFLCYFGWMLLTCELSPSPIRPPLRVRL